MCLQALSHLRHYAKWAFTPWQVDVKLGPRHDYHKGQAALRHHDMLTNLSRGLLHDYATSPINRLQL